MHTAHLTYAPAQYGNLVTYRDADAQALWFAMNVRPRPCFTWDLIRDILRFQHDFAKNSFGLPRPRCLVFASESPGIFSLGGDLSLFQSVIERQDRRALEQYAEDCVAVIYNHMHARDVVTVSVLEGDALGAGLESALTSDVVIAERGTRAGFPESLFNLVPGHGAYFLLARRVGPRLADKMIREGNAHTAEELHDLGLVDILVGKGEGRAAVRELLQTHQKSWNAFLSLQLIKRHHQPITREALQASAAVWVDAAMRLSKRDLRMMERLVRAQEKRTGIAPAEAPASVPQQANTIVPLLSAAIA